MNKKIVYPISIISICVVVVVWWWYCLSVTTLIFVRHADRDGSNDALTEAGEDRAEALVHVAEKTGATAIYHSGANRTRLTATPLANALGIAMTEQADAQLTINDILTYHLGETVIVSGHSDTVPEMIGLAGGPAVPPIDHDEYDNLFVLSRCNCWFGANNLLKLQYGAVSP